MPRRGIYHQADTEFLRIRELTPLTDKQAESSAVQEGHRDTCTPNHHSSILPQFLAEIIPAFISEAQNQDALR